MTLRASTALAALLASTGLASFTSTSFVGHAWRIRDKATRAIVADVRPLTGDTTLRLP